MKIDTLVTDIHKLVTEGKEGGATGPTLLDTSTYMKLTSAPVVKERPEKTFYFSEIGDPCVKRLWYKFHQPHLATSHSAPTLIKFEYGNMLEQLVLNLTVDAGHTVSDWQKPLEYALKDGWKVRGKIDAVIDNVLVDVKSVTARSEEKFKRGLADDPFGYYMQLNGYATAAEYPEAGFLTIQKELGHINYYPIKVNPTLFFERMDILVDAMHFPAAEDLPRGFDPIYQTPTSKNMKLAAGCSYCDFKKECWKDSNDGKGLRAFNYASGPVFLVKVEDTPRVPEITM